jgi:hypothetical protein
VWIEHYPKEATDGHSETFELVVFSSYEVKETAPYLGETKRDEAYHRRAFLEDPRPAERGGVGGAGSLERALSLLATKEPSYPPILRVWGEGRVP